MRFLILALWVLVLLALAVSTVNGENLVLNGGFEEVINGIEPVGWTNTGCITGWYALDRDIDVFDGLYSAYCDPYSGDSIPTWMANAAALPAGEYHVSLWASWVRHYGPAMTLYVVLGESLLTFDVAEDWHEYTGTVYTLAPANLLIGAWAAGDDSIALDNVSASTPEPPGFFMLLLGGLATWLRKRRNRRAVRWLATQMADDSGEQEESWDIAKAAIEKNRMSCRPRFEGD